MASSIFLQFNGVSVDTSTGTSTVPVGTGGATETIGGTLYSSTTAASTTGLVEETLQSYTMPANTLAVNTRGVRITCWGKTAANANNKTVLVYFGATQIAFVGAAALNNASWHSVSNVGRITNTTQTASGGGIFTATNWQQIVTAPAETLSGAVLIKVTGTGPTTIGDVTVNGLLVEAI